MSNKIIWEADVNCTSCYGTGIYQGMAELNGAGVVCAYCKGSGKQHVKHEYAPFEGRVPTKKVNRVYKTAAGYGISSKDVTTPEGKFIAFSKAGATYQEWLDGKELKPITDLHCPLEHYEQSTKEGKWLKGHHCKSNGLNLGGYIPYCSRKNRDHCWGCFSRGDFKW